jgi:hypothetical protein
VSETAAAAAPAAAPAAPSAAPAQASAAPADAKAPPTEAAWDNEQEAQFLKMLSKSPYGKVKANGKEEAIDSADKLKALMLDAQRGKGATKLAEEAKREKAEAAQAKQQADLAMRALKGDAAALRALGITDPAEQQAREQALAEVPPEVRAVIERAEAAEARIAEFEAREAEAKQAEEQRRTMAVRDQVRTEALGFAKSLVESLGTGEEAEALLPYTLRAMHDLGAEGLRMGVDVSPEQVQQFARQLFDADGVQRVDRLAPKSFLGAALKRLETMPVKDVVAGLSPKMRVAIAKELAQQRVAAKTQAQPKPAEAQSERPSTSTMPQPMSPFRFGR